MRIYIYISIMNLSKMLESTHEKYSANQEPPVANFYPDLDMKWPEPQSFNKVKKEKEPPPLRKMFSWWSSPPNVLLDERISLSSAEEDLDCWSAPECLDDDVSCESEEEEEPSLCSIHLPSSSGSAASPSPSRPPSPVLGRPPCITGLSCFISLERLINAFIPIIYWFQVISDHQSHCTVTFLVMGIQLHFAIHYLLQVIKTGSDSTKLPHLRDTLLQRDTLRNFDVVGECLSRISLAETGINNDNVKKSRPLNLPAINQLSTGGMRR
uniref:FH2 domain-containing protein n=1 Tax=Heterorhabditis bacteriophora TaxID=37862 RepID=A0A1I7X136_HETBA